MHPYHTGGLEPAQHLDGRSVSERIAQSALFAKLPPPWPAPVRAEIRHLLESAPFRPIVVLDDDPTGAQTIRNVPVLTVWNEQLIRTEFENRTRCFYLLTNSRSLVPSAAAALNQRIALDLRKAAGAQPFILVSRGDSTLRGHFPMETDVLSAELGPFHGCLLAPYFEAGGRYTIGDVHYVAEGSDLVPVGETPFAKDPAFGYKASNLRDYVREKTGGAMSAEKVTSIPIEVIRCGGPDAVMKLLQSTPPGSVVIVNACRPSDLDVVACAILQEELEGRRWLCRTAAQFVASILGQEPGLLWTPSGAEPGLTVGGLIVVGSHVPRTTGQLNHLLRSCSVKAVELSVPQLLGNDGETVITAALKSVQAFLRSGHDIMLYTSRDLIPGSGGDESLSISGRVSDAISSIVSRLAVAPRFILTKGGITSSDLATKALGVRRAQVLGQILPGVPVWELGSETRCPGMPYVIFPGNVGGPEALAEATRILSGEQASHHLST
ncbi:MAG: hypothetical protein FJ405_02400 [Verrucomicrobia bacterium]|nr:hypothetical protein [Verrucomicrobiota bacterium]